MRWIACLMLGFSTLAQETSIKLSVVEGDLHDRDCRVFGLPVSCNGVSATFTWGCGGETIVSQNFARKANLEIKPNPDQAGYVDGNGKPLFMGDAMATLSFGDKAFKVVVWVMRDAEYNKGMNGIIGYEVAKQFQWEIDPRGPTMTLRPLKAAPKEKPLATLPLREENQNFWINIKLRNVETEVCLIPQSTDFQAGAELQKKWDLAHTGRKSDTATYLGSVRTIVLEGKSGMYLGKTIFEPDVLAILLDNNPNARSGIGQSLLNRFVYCVDPGTKQFHVLARVKLEETRASTRPAR